MQDKETRLVFYGVRGSRPAADKSVYKYGGNTASILIERDDKVIILDAGTGIINIGNYLEKEKPAVKKIDIFLTHFHFDHILGLPFFQPILSKEYEINIYTPPYEKDERTAEDIVLTIFNQPYSPIMSTGIKARLTFIELDMKKNAPLNLGDGISIGYKKDDSHPRCGIMIYKLNIHGKAIIYATDVETPEGFNEEMQAFIEGADVLIHDSQYFDAHYTSEANPRKGFGHSSVSMAVNNAKNGKVKKLYLFHYDPLYSDEELETMLEAARTEFKDTFLSEELKKINL